MKGTKRWARALIALIVWACALGLAAPALADEAQPASPSTAQEPAEPEVYETEMVPWAFSSFANEEGALTAYDSDYRVSYAGSQVATTNGQWGQNAPAHVADDTDAFWEPGNNNNPSNISITITFTKPETFQWVVYGSRLDAGLKGFPTEFELAISDAESGEADWKTVTHGTGAATSSLCAFDACPDGSSITARRVRFTFKQSLQSYPSCRALRFYKEDPAEHVLDGLWANYNHTELAEGVSYEGLAAKIAEVRNNPSYATIYAHLYQPELERVKAAEEGLLEANPRLEMSNEANVPEGERSTKALVRVGDVASYARNTLKFSNNTTNRQVTGVWYPAGEVARIWVERENEDDPLPIVRWAQPYGYWASWQGGATQLVEGLNLVTVPNYKTVDYKTYDIVAGCAAYLENPYTAEDQDGLVRVYFEGGRTFPVYRLGDDIDAYMAELRAHADRVRADHTSEMDVTELVGNHVMMTVQATRADEIYGARGHDAKQALECWNTTLTRCYAFEGIQLDPAQDGYDARNEYLNENYRVSQVWDLGWMFTAGEHIGVYTGGEAQDVLIDPLDSYGQSKIASNWGLIHEWGHSIDIPARTLQETTNNMPAYFESTFTPEFTRNATDIERAHQMAQPDYAWGTKFNENRFNFMPFWLVESYWPGWWGRVENLYRYEPVNDANGYAGGKDQLNKTERFVLYASIAAGYDLRPFYERWGLNMDAANPVFKAETASPAFQTLFDAREAEGRISKHVDGFSEDVADLPIWLLDRGEYGAVTGAGGSHGALQIYTGVDDAPEISHVVPATKTVASEDGTRTTNDVVNVVLKKSTDANHLCYLVEARAKGSGDEEAWTYAGSTHGGVFTDERPEAAGGALEYRVKAVDRSLHESAYSEPKAPEEPKVVARYRVTMPDMETYELKTETKEFESLDKAVESAKDEQTNVTIELLTDCYAGDVQVKQTVKIAVAPEVEGAVTIARSGSGPIFDIAEGAKLELAGSEGHEIVLDGLFAEGQAAGVRLAQTAAKLEATHVTFQNFVNAADGEAGRGGAIGGLIASGGTTLNHCTFKNNTATEGGAFAARSTNVLTDCTFEGNTATSRGGALRNFSGGVLTLKTCTFTGNRSVYGGAVSLEGNTVALGCTIEGNTAKFGGGIDASLGARSLGLDDADGTPTIVQGNTAIAGDALYLASNDASTVFVADATIGGSGEEGHRAVQIAQGKLVVNATSADCTSPIKTLKGDFDAQGASTVQGTIAEMGSSKVVVSGQWAAEPLQLEVAEIGRAQAVAEVNGFEGTDFAEHVQLVGHTGTLSLDWRGTDDASTPGVYVARGGTVTLEANGGEIKAGDVDGYVAGAETFLPTNVVKTGCSFVGWFDNEELEGASVKCVPASATGNVTYWAKWSQGNYWINYRPNGGKLPAGYQDHRSLEETVTLAEPTREGFEFLGWYEKSDFQGEPLAEIASGTHEGTTTLYARWSHERNKGEVVEEVGATCTSAGHKTVAYKCVDCEKDMGAEVVEIPATGHNFGGWSKAEENPCQGTTVRSRTCKTCGYVEYEGLDDAAASHAWGEWTPVADHAATCTSDGLEERTCSVCHVREERVVPALGHTFEAAATISTFSEGDADEDEPTERVIPPTCEDDGVRELLGTCTRCLGTGLVRDTEVLPATAHAWGEWTVLQEANCATQTGGIRQHTCETCNETIAEITPYEHAWEASPRIDVPPTCTSTGIASTHCATCGATKDAHTLEVAPHDYVDGVCAACGAIEPGTGNGTTAPGNGELDTPGSAGDAAEPNTASKPVEPDTASEPAEPDTASEPAPESGDATEPDANDAPTPAPHAGEEPVEDDGGTVPADPATGEVPVVDGPGFTGVDTSASPREASSTAKAQVVPKTGDETPILAYVVIGIAGLACLAAGIVLIVRQRA